MKKITKELIKELANDVMLELTEDEIDAIYEMENIFYKRFEKTKKIDTSNIEPAHFPFDTINTFLRDDDQTDAINVKNVLDNAPSVEDDYIIIKRVVG